MQLRRFTADTTPAALDAVREALGDDAIILANRRVGEQVEIIATAQLDEVALDAEGSEHIHTPTVAPSAQETRQVHIDGSITSFRPFTPVRIDADAAPTRMHEENAATRPRYADIKDHDELDAIGDDTVSLSASAAAAAQASDGSLARESVTAGAITTSADEGLHSSEHNTSLTPLPHAGTMPTAKRQDGIPGQAGHNGHRTQGGIDLNADRGTRVAPTLASVASALEAQARMLDQHFRSQEVNLWGVNAPERSQHLQQLLSLGIGAEMAIRLVEQCSAQMGVEAGLRQSLALLKSSLRIASDRTFDVPGVTIMYGPPGAGKTTALMKLATEHVRQNDNQSIVIICADTRRIGAFEELQAYGRLLGVPTVHAHDAAELTSLTSAFTHKKLVLIDHTLPMDERAVPLPPALREPSDPNTVRHLFALPATAQSTTAEMLIRHQLRTRNMHLVLTNLDASARLGELLNILIRHETPVAYWSDDASVQAPLQRADASVLIATAVAMRKRIGATVDDQWLHRLIQPSNRVFTQFNEVADATGKNHE